MKEHTWRPDTTPRGVGVYSYVCSSCGFVIKYRVESGRTPPSVEVLRRMAGPGVIPADCDEAAKVAAVRLVHES